MNLQSCDRAKKMAAADLVEGIPAAEREWLDAHLAACGECANEARALAAAIRSVRAFHLSANPDAVRRTRLAVHQRAGQRRREQERAASIWIAVAASSVWAIITTPYAWSAFASFGQSFQLPDAAWQLGFLMWWFLPATALAAVAGWLHS